jgi:hypothetical protein
MLVGEWGRLLARIVASSSADWPLRNTLYDSRSGHELASFSLFGISIKIKIMTAA